MTAEYVSRNWPTGVLAIITAFYAYGALVHVLNMAGMSGFAWSEAPLKWQVLDVVYLVLDLIVCIGLVRRRPSAVYAFYAASFSQIVLYTLLRDWVVDVPDAFAVSEAQRGYLTTLVIFHVVALAFVTAALRATRTAPDPARSTTWFCFR